MNKVQKLIARLLIPRGDYCKGCPFHFIDNSRKYQENGYCSYLKKGDWNINDEYPEMIEVQKRQEDGSYKKVMVNKYDEPICNSFSLLWDGCKECNVRCLNQKKKEKDF